MNPQSLFVVFEGTDGSGTTTQGDLLAEALRHAGRNVVRTAQPSDGEIGRLLRQTLRDHRSDHRLDPVSVALLFAADRVDHCERVIRPALLHGNTVICDRYVGSSLAFQVVDGGGAIDAEWLLSTNRAAIRPDISLLLDVPVVTALSRIQRRGKPRERFEYEETLQRVQARYREVFAKAPPLLGKTLTLDANRPREAIAYDVLGAVMQVLAERGLAGREART